MYFANYIIFSHDFLHKGGVPNENRNWVQELNKLANVLVICNSRKSLSEYEKTNSNLNIEKINLISLFNRFFNKISKNDIVLITGYFIPINIIVAVLCRIKKIRYGIMPFSSLSRFSLNNDIFKTDPDVRLLENKHKHSKELYYKYFIVNKTVILKKIFHKMFHNILLEKAYFIGVFSSYEKEEILKLTNVPLEKFVNFRWGLKNTQETYNKTTFFDTLKKHPNTLNFVYWGRLDFKMKGIDRLLNAVGILKEKHATLPFEIYLMGPDYGGGQRKIEALVEKLDISDYVHICGPGVYQPGSKQPLIDADASIYFSRWDGFPRTLRESVMYGVPIIVSEETHFGDLVKQYGWGIEVKKDSDLSAYANALLQMCDNNFRRNCIKSCLEYRYVLSWENQVKEFFEAIQRLDIKRIL
jgi:glycosyltransferase involved in cell wall biosynthesis